MHRYSVRNRRFILIYTRLKYHSIERRECERKLGSKRWLEREFSEKVRVGEGKKVGVGEGKRV